MVTTGNEIIVYLVIVVILVILIVVATTILADYYNKNYQCKIYPNFWCWNDWGCPNGGPTGVGYAASLFGPTSTFATTCQFPSGATCIPASCQCSWTNQDAAPCSNCNVRQPTAIGAACVNAAPTCPTGDPSNLSSDIPLDLSSDVPTEASYPTDPFFSRPVSRDPT